MKEQKIEPKIEHAPDCGLNDCWCGRDADNASPKPTGFRYDVVCPKHDRRKCTCGAEVPTS